MDFEFCKALADVSSIGHGFKELKYLQHLEMYFVQCRKLADVSSIGQGPKELKNLQHLKINNGRERVNVGGFHPAYRHIAGIKNTTSILCITL